MACVCNTYSVLVSDEAQSTPSGDESVAHSLPLVDEQSEPSLVPAVPVPMLRFTIPVASTTCRSMWFSLSAT
eukprot:5513710-Prymnesium_polylepis.1